MINDNLLKYKQRNTCLILYGQIIDTKHLIRRLNYYKKIIKNIILITYEISVKHIKHIILKYIQKDNLILIPSNKTGKGIQNKIKLCPFKITQPDFTFYTDSSWVYPPNMNLKEPIKTKSITFRYPVYVYMQKYKQKYKYCLILRNDADITLNRGILKEMIIKADNNKIVLPQHTKCKRDKKYMDKNNNFFLTSRSKEVRNFYSTLDKPPMMFECANYFQFSKTKLLYNFLNIGLNNTNFTYNISKSGGECWLFGTYIIEKNKYIEGTYLSKKKIEKFINKSFDFIKYTTVLGTCRFCYYINRIFRNSKKSVSTNLKYHCIICKQKMF
tara:strand:- start:44 stop:1027 length:984 start_codon:yes stop_codon:yes gene_type:complete